MTDARATPHVGGCRRRRHPPDRHPRRGGPRCDRCHPPWLREMSLPPPPQAAAYLLPRTAVGGRRVGALVVTDGAEVGAPAPARRLGVRPLTPRSVHLQTRGIEDTRVSQAPRAQ